MYTEKIVALSCLLVLSGLNVRAQQINWNGNPLQQFQSALAEQKTVAAVPKARLVVLMDAPVAASVINLEGKALGSSVLSNDDYAYNDRISLTLNQAKDRVGATFTNCPPNAGDDYPVDCESVDFVFPQLTVDAKAIKLGEEVVASKSFFGAWTLTEGWRFAVTKSRQTRDDGFNRHHITRVSIALVK